MSTHGSKFANETTADSLEWTDSRRGRKLPMSMNGPIVDNE